MHIFNICTYMLSQKFKKLFVFKDLNNKGGSGAFLGEGLRFSCSIRITLLCAQLTLDLRFLSHLRPSIFPHLSNWALQFSPYRQILSAYIPPIRKHCIALEFILNRYEYHRSRKMLVIIKHKLIKRAIDCKLNNILPVTFIIFIELIYISLYCVLINYNITSTNI